jgi:CMP-N-acetylneuraminic acid synthetase
MVEKKENGYYNLIKQGVFLSRQTAPEVFELNASIYVYKRIFFNSNDLKIINEKSTIYLMPHICFDLDHNLDFEFMNYLIEENKLGFQL